MLIAAVIGLLWTHGVKHAAAVPRPAAVLASEAFHGIGALAVSGSFPSGHSQTAMTLASVACLTLRRRAWQGAALALGLAVCASRVIVGMHWPVDVLAGGAGGILSVLAAHLIVDRLGPPRAGPVILLLGLCLTAAVMVCAGHPAGYPAAQPWFRLLGLACLGGFLWGLLRTRA